MRVYCVHFIIEAKDLWFSETPPFEVQRSAEHYFLNISMFLAADSDSAYAKAMAMIDGLSDANHDGLGDRTNFSCVGIHELEDVAALDDLEEELTSHYGLEVSTLTWTATDVPVAKLRDELRVFRYPR
ncbi:MAG: hypothetical protein ACREP7_11725 [Lysobacter sp.]